jgi:ATP-dependent Clp protease ATP-binding subunit ClpA
MFERFTDRARRVIVMAQAHARDLDYNYIGTEHLLLGLMSDEDGIAYAALTTLGFTSEDIKVQVKRGGHPDASGHIPYTPQTKKVLELSLREALQLGHNYIGTEHLLLGLVRDGGGKGAELLGADLGRVRQQVLKTLAEKVKEMKKQSLHVVGIREPDEQWLRMKTVFDACQAAHVDLPSAVEQFFGALGPDESGMPMDLSASIVDWSTTEHTGVELILAHLPEKVTRLRFYLS